MSEDRLVRALISHELVPVLGVESEKKIQAEAFTKSFVRNSMRTMTPQQVSEMLEHKAVVLQYARPQQKDKKRTSKKAKGLNARGS